MRNARSLLLASLLCAALLAGCSGNGTHSASNTSTTGPAGPSADAKLATPTLIPEVLLGPGDGEPNIAVAPDGTIYITPVSNFYVSTDGGKSFTDRGTDKTTGHGDGDIAVDDRGCVHWMGLGGGIPWQVSCDQGKTFSKAVDVSDGTGSDREWIDAVGSQIVGSWRDSAGYVSITSQDYGQTWGPKVKVSASSFLGGPVIHDPTMPTRLWLPAVESNRVDLYRSDDAGASWKASPVMELPNGAADLLQSTQIFPVVAADASGHLYVVVSTKQVTNENVDPTLTPKQASIYGIYLTQSNDLGATWSEPRLLSTPQKDGVMPFITAGATGRIAVVWYENVVGLPDDVLPDEWNVKMMEGIGMENGTGQTTTVQLNGAPNHIGGLCSNGLACVAGGDRCLLDYFEVALNPQGQPVVTWSSCALGTGVGVAVQGTTIYYGGIATGTPLK